MIEQDVDVLIIGGGLIGATLLLALKELGYRILLVEKKSYVEHAQGELDSRSLALSPASQRILTQLGCWKHTASQATPIQLIHVSQQNHFGAARLYGSTDNPLGYVVEMQALHAVLQQQIPSELILTSATVTAIDLEQQTAVLTTKKGTHHVKAKLIVAADGAESTIRQFCNIPVQRKEYRQHALVTNVKLAKPHKNQAYERFTTQGPLALLPLSEDRMSVVWTLTQEDLHHLLSCSDKVFLQQLQLAFGYRVGRFIRLGTRSSFPLKHMMVRSPFKGSVVFIGNAAHTLHPVAGQGFNLGLRDVAMLAQCIAQHGLQEKTLVQYSNLRRGDQMAISQFTDSLVQLFTSTLPGLGIARGLGLFTFDLSLGLKKLLARYAQGFGGVVPDLVCNVALEKVEHETQ